MTDTPTHRVTKSLSAAVTLALLSACAGNNSPSNVEAPGKPTKNGGGVIGVARFPLFSVGLFCGII